MAGLVKKDLLNIYFDSIKGYEPLTQEEERKYIQLAQNGDINARNKVVNANLKFVIKVAKDFHIPNVSTMDIISEGNLGLIEAVERFDVNQQTKFITYAVWWIRQAIIKFLQDKVRLIRIPINKNNELAEIYKKIEEYKKDNNEINLGKIADELNIKKTSLRNIINASMPICSLDKEYENDDNNSSTSYDMIASDEDTPEEALIKESESNHIRKVIDTLPERIALVIKMRYGMGDYGEMNLEDIGEILNLTKERVRQLECEGLKLLREKLAS